MALWFSLKSEVEKWEKKEGNIKYLCKLLKRYREERELEIEMINRGVYICMLELPLTRRIWLEMMIVCKRVRIVQSLNQLNKCIEETDRGIYLLYNKVPDVNFGNIRKKYITLINECGIEDDICYFEVYKPKYNEQKKETDSKYIEWKIIEDYETIPSSVVSVDIKQSNNIVMYNTN